MFAKKSINCLTFGVMVIGMIFAVLATEGKYWESYLFEKSKSVYTGLWLFCRFQFSKENCIKRSINNPLRVVQTFMVMGCFGYLVSLFYVVCYYIKKKSNFKTLSVILNVTALSLVIGLSVYSNEISTQHLKYNWSYAVGWTSVIFALIASILCLVVHGRYLRQ